MYRRTYRRGSEEWRDTVARVVEGSFEILARHCVDNGCTWDESMARLLAEDMYERAFTFKFLPPGRGLWLMGTDFVRTKGGAGLNNCGFCSTENIATELSLPFEFLMDMSMLGVSVGFDVRGAGKVVWAPSSAVAPVWDITDDREGWVDSTGRILRWGFGHGDRPRYNYDGIRLAGVPIRGFGGTASGPGPLLALHEALF